ncbi:hypothetical protein HMPREF9103_02907 [Lentilactobacillus parafarraginis F0439]|uniref:Uncharacterized protein n=1 Tax=Lentilactobacillus parafarraginis F0439 TaxID=797515 RepID=G9ZSY9_9LACO|nr:hypothetical protein HMPREF9103_02907 [Lentilactobacillus parafarraginis F0439]
MHRFVGDTMIAKFGLFPRDCLDVFVLTVWNVVVKLELLVVIANCGVSLAL